MNRAFIYLVLASLLWSGNFIIGRATHNSIGPLTLSSWRWVVAALLLSPWLISTLKNQHFSLPQWLKLIFMAFVSVGCYNTLIYIGLQFTSAPNGVLLNSMIPFFIILLGVVLFKERLVWQEIFGVMLSAIGVSILVCKGNPYSLLSFNFHQGDLWILIAGFCWALYTSLLSRWRPVGLNGLSFLALIASIGVMFILLARLINPFNESSMELSLTNIAVVSYVSLAASIAAWLFYNQGVKLIGAERAGQSIHFMPVFVSILAYFLLDERLYAYHLLGAGFILLGLIVANKLSLGFTRV